MSILSYDQLPLTFSGLVIENTSRCNAACSMCYQAAGPNGSDFIGKQQLTNEVVKRALDDALKIETLTRRFHLAGGEAFLKPQDCFELIDYARSVGYLCRSATSNCYWATKLEKARTFASDLKDSGLTHLEISWDIWHKPFIKAEAINHAIAACSEVGIHTNLRILTTKSHSIHEALSSLDPTALDLANEVTSGPVFKTGKAAKTIDSQDFYGGGALGASCHSVLNLTVNAKGDVYPCCAGADQTESLAFGNINQRSISDIFKDMDRSALLRTLVFSGVGAFIPILEDAGVIFEEKHRNICHMCWDIFSVPSYANIIFNHFQKIQMIAKNTALAALGDSYRGELIEVSNIF